ncbi:hypothetical protein RHSIM_Rhsim12G0139500 [Rhododendron simsii]|uniref:MFT-like protein n=1 Tax=Rhododendron simsii TaxID=118357 RepID=A0A834G5H4_RHOSS|nr:hypothetical protein RHSIM_Rhsim12G0139500 [Rhododendron simsii]
MMGTSVDPLVVGRVIGDVVDMFVPSVTMNVYFDARHVMTDPDAPSPSEPSMREWVHWIVTDIPGGTGPTEGKEVVPYMGPRPPVGIHRYIFVLFQQRAPLGGAGVRMDQQQPVSHRANFNTRAFAHQLDLGFPVSTVYFNAHKEPANRRR